MLSQMCATNRRLFLSNQKTYTKVYIFSIYESIHVVNDLKTVF